MACFLVPAAEAAVTAIVAKKTSAKDEAANEAKGEITVKEAKIPMSKKLRWLNYMLIGGAVLLAFEHIWHGEVVPWFPFLTAASSPASLSEMLMEMATVGALMAVLVTGVWIVMCVVADSLVKKENRARDARLRGTAV